MVRVQAIKREKARKKLKELIETLKKEGHSEKKIYNLIMEAYKDDIGKEKKMS